MTAYKSVITILKAYKNTNALTKHKLPHEIFVHFLLIMIAQKTCVITTTMNHKSRSQCRRDQCSIGINAAYDILKIRDKITKMQKQNIIFKSFAPFLHSYTYESSRMFQLNYDCAGAPFIVILCL